MKGVLRAVASCAAAALLVAGGLLSFATQEARAQQQGVTVRLDTTVQQQAARGAGPASVQSVRRRIRQIGGAPPVQRVIYPMVVVPFPPPGAAGPRGAAGTSTVPFQAPYYMPGGGGARPGRRSYYDLLTGENGEDDLIPIRPDSAAPPVAAPPSVRRIERAILETGLFRASNVNFEVDRSTLLPASENTLNAIGEVLARYPALRIAVEGHTDATGSDAYNQALSERRAESVARYLSRNLGIGAGRLQPVGYGEARPVASNSNATGRTLNRRVTFRVLNPEAAERYLETEVPAEEETATERDSLLREAIREGVREGMEEATGTGAQRP